ARTVARCPAPPADPHPGAEVPGHAERRAAPVRDLAGTNTSTTSEPHAAVPTRCQVRSLAVSGGRAHALVIRHGTVVDGTGAPSRVADVAIDDGVVSAIGGVD